MCAKDRAGHWKSKNAAVYLVTSLAQKGSTAKHGTTKTSELVNLQDFFDNHIIKELSAPNGEHRSIIHPWDSRDWWLSCSCILRSPFSIW